MMRWAQYANRIYKAPLGLSRASWRRQTSLWLPAAVLGALVITLGAWRLSLDVLPLALDAQSVLAEFQRLSAGDLVSGDSASLADLQVKVDAIELEVGHASRYLTWMAYLVPAFGWLPVLDHEIVAWAAQMERLRRDIDSATELLSISSQLLDAYERAQDDLLSTQTGSMPPIPNAQMRDLESSFASTFQRLENADCPGGLITPVYRVPRIRNALDLLTQVEDQMLTASEIGWHASGLLVELLTVGDQARSLLGQLVGDQYEHEPLTAEALETTVAELNSSLQFALVRSRQLDRLLADNELSATMLNQHAMLQKVLIVLLSVNRAAMVGLQVLEPALEDTQASRGGLLGDGGSLAPALDSVDDHRSELDEALVLLKDAQQTLADLESTSDLFRRLPGSADLVQVVSLLHEGLQLVLNIAPIGAELVGDGSAMQYLILSQSADELRATGGFVSAIWLATFENGGLADLRYHDVVLVDDTERLMLYPEAPLGLEEHMNAHVWLLRDVSWEPDFPTTAPIAAAMYKIGQRQDVQGVVALNQWTLLAIVQAIGSVSSPEGGPPITPRNLLAKLEEETDEHGRAYTDLILQGIIERLNQPLSLPMLMRLASAIYASFQERDLLLFLVDPELQTVVRDNGWDGSVREYSADYLYVVDSNVGWSKADRNIERKVDYQIDLSRESGVRINLTLRYNNFSGPGSPGCEPQWLNRGKIYSQLKNACYWNYWRVYIPQGAKLLKNTPLPLLKYSVSAETRRGQPGEDTFRVSSSYGKAVLSGLFALPAGEENEVNLVYDLPADVVRHDGEDILYQLLIQKQPGSRRRDVSVDFILPPDYSLSSSSIAPSFTDDSRVGFQIRVDQDTVLGAVFTRGDNGPG